LLLEIAIGDAYGAGFEFSSREKITTYNDLSQYHEHELGFKAGNYTDDTQMSLAIAELLIAKTKWTRENIADKFVECFKRDERLGYSKSLYLFLQSINTGTEFINKMKPHSHYYIYNLGAKENLTEFVSEYTKFKWNDNWSAPVACCGEETVNALLTVLKQSTSLKETLIKSVAFSGDVDTVAALGFGIASLCEAYERTLPRFLFTELENKKYGKDYLESIDQKLNEFRPGC